MVVGAEPLLSAARQAATKVGEIVFSISLRLFFRLFCFLLPNFHRAARASFPSDTYYELHIYTRENKNKKTKNLDGLEQQPVAQAPDQSERQLHLPPETQ